LGYLHIAQLVRQKEEKVSEPIYITPVFRTKNDRAE
jgi:hypothetical protein